MPALGLAGTELLEFNAYPLDPENIPALHSMICINDTMVMSRYVFNHLQGGTLHLRHFMAKTVIIPDTKYKMEVTVP